MKFRGASLDSINRKSYALKDTVEGSRRSTTIKPAERVILEKLAVEARGKPILDIGAGTGRLVGPLTKISEDYTAIDYTPGMVAIMRKKHPGIRVHEEDARDLARFESGSFFLIVFAWNGLDSVDHEGRQDVLREVYRLLQPGGIFVFSSHNRESDDHDQGFRFERIDLTMNPLCLTRRVAGFSRRTLISLFNHARLRRREVRCAGYSILNDEAHNYSIMIYFITIPNARKQLEAVGFLPEAEAFDVEGNLVTGRCRDGTIHYVARKPG